MKNLPCKPLSTYQSNDTLSHLQHMVCHIQIHLLFYSDIYLFRAHLLGVTVGQHLATLLSKGYFLFCGSSVSSRSCRLHLEMSSSSCSSASVRSHTSLCNSLWRETNAASARLPLQGKMAQKNEKESSGLWTPNTHTSHF